MSDIEWPEGATHGIDGKIVKWVDGIEFNFERGAWERPLLNWSLARYIKEDAKIIERPKELEAKEPVINWDEQPTLEHSAIVSNIHDNAVLWMRHIGGGSYQHDDGRIYQDSRMFTVYEKPETEPYKPEVGDNISLISKDKNIDSIWEAKFIASTDYSVFVVLPTLQEKLYRLEVFSIEPLKSERDQVIERALSIYNCGKYSLDMAEALYDKGLLRIPDEG